MPVESSQQTTQENVAVIGLGYVGFPLSILLSEKHENVVGFDISERRVTMLKEGVDTTGEISAERIKASSLKVTNDPSDLERCTFYIVTVPTPINKSRRPDLSPLQSACALVGPYLVKGDVVVFESTVYPGVTENICGPLLEEACGLEAGVDFFLGYSPERINPGDKKNPLESIVKNISADCPESLERVAAVYEPVITAGIFRCSSIKVAEGAKVLENTQRDVNIALMNELALICDRIDISTREVIEAASTKWNFIPFYPGLVGGHCIGVDPYYLSSLSEEVGHHPEVILAGRRLNDSMSSYVANVILKKLVQRGGSIRNAKVGVFGVTFKENVPDMRNSKSMEMVEELKSFGLNVMTHDPLADPEEARALGVEFCDLDDMIDLEVMVVSVAHSAYMKDVEFLNRLVAGGTLIDIKSSYIKADLPDTIEYWTL